MIRDWSPFSRDPWHIDENRKTIDEGRKRKKLGDFEIEEKIVLMKKARGFVSVLVWDDLSTRFKNKYLAGKNEFSYKGMEMADEGLGKGGQADKYKDRLETAALNLRDKGMSTQEISEILDTPTRTLYGYFNSANASINSISNNNKHLKGVNFSKSLEEDNK
jgi:hypothetical protein